MATGDEPHVTTETNVVETEATQLVPEIAPEALEIAQPLARKRVRQKPRQSPLSDDTAPKQVVKVAAIRQRLRKGVAGTRFMTPDREAEVQASRLHQSAKRQHSARPQLPSVTEKVEIHTNEIRLLYIRHYEPCNQYAIAIDSVARERLTDRAVFNAYLQEFDDAIADLTSSVTKLYAKFEEASSGSKASNKSPIAIQVDVQTRRSLQILRVFQRSDDVVRMINFLNIYDDLDDRTANSALKAVTDSINKCAKTLRRVKLACFKKIVELENLSVPVNDGTTFADIAAARKAEKRNGKPTTLPIKPGQTSEIQPDTPPIDPSENALEPLPNTSLPAAE